MRAVVFGLLSIMVSVSSALASDNGLITKPSKYPVAETLTRLEGVLKSRGMSIFARIDHQAEAEKAGLQMRPAQLLIFGNPKGGTPLMVASPTAAIDLPLKALAWEDADGKVWLSYNAMSYLRTRHDIQGKEELIANLDGALDAMTSKALE
jgi:YD repeat-containing protein